MIATLHRAIVVALLAVWIFPAAGFARSNDSFQTAPPAASESNTTAGRTGAAAKEEAPTPAQQFAERERQSRGVEDFRGGEASIYIGGGAVTVLLLILLIVVLV